MLQEQPRTLEESVRLLQASLLRANPNAVITNSELVLSKPTSAPLAIAPSVGSLSEEEGLISQ